MSGNIYARRAVVDAVVFDQLLLPGHNPVFQPYTLKGGFQYLSGTVLGRVTASGLLKTCVLAAGDGSEVPFAVLVDRVDAFLADGTTAKDTTCAVAVHGYFNRTALRVDASLNLDTVCAQLRSIGIYTRAPGYSG